MGKWLSAHKDQIKQEQASDTPGQTFLEYNTIYLTEHLPHCKESHRIPEDRKKTTNIVGHPGPGTIWGLPYTETFSNEDNVRFLNIKNFK